VQGRWMTPDWAAKPTTVPYAEFGDPQTLNLYVYVGNRPLNRADADGHTPAEFVARHGDRSGQGFGSPGDGSLGDSFEEAQALARYNKVAPAQQTNYMQGAAGGPINTDPTNSSQNASNYGPWEMRVDALNFIDNNKECSVWLNSGGGNAHDLMSNVPIILVNASARDRNPADGQTSSNPKAPIEVVAQGRFYTNSVRGDPIFGYQPGSWGARMTILLHELSHKLNIPKFLNDGFSIPQSETNTQLLLQHCIF
jgi:hypothetical protein